ncbi:O-succinylbenzoic acid--CoA ligase [Marisediminicola sp. UYEF4]|uniref:AMP-binding protein n=1 Tax=Marisediminicola sp. UYEF4 TaxID=1756384 RepID=UPI00339A78E3
MGSSRDGRYGGVVVTRELIVIDASDPVGVLDALRLALSAAGPAILPLPPEGPRAGLPDGARVPQPPPPSVPKPIAVVVQTSGSSGTAKRVELSSNALLASAAASSAALGGPGQWLLALPVHYIAGINVLVRSIAAQTEPVILPPGHFDAGELLAAAATMDPATRHFTSVVPAQLARLLDVAGDDAAGDAAALASLRSFDRILVGGQSVPSELIERADALGVRVTRTYGSSETAGGCVYDGVPIGTTELRIRQGEIEIGGPMLADGYLGDPARTERSFVMSDGARWYRTGDAGRLDDGVLTVTGRLDRVVISGGVKVSLDELERVVRRMPGLGDAVAVPAESARWGEVPVIVTTSPVDLSVLRGEVAAALGREAAPDRIVVLDSIPLLPTGKPDLVALREIVGRRN